MWGIPLDPGLAWPRYVTEVDGLQWLASFAPAHHKPAVIPEWGLTIRSDGHGLGDDPFYVAKMAQWISTHDVAFTSYFDVDAPDGHHDILDHAFSRSLAVFERSFAARRARAAPGRPGRLARKPPAPCPGPAPVRPPAGGPRSAHRHVGGVGDVMDLSVLGRC